MPDVVCSSIGSIRVPSLGPDDIPIWAHSADGLFTIKSAYLLLHEDSGIPSFDFPFKLIWQLRTPPRVNTFLWKVVHQRLMTNCERHTRGIFDSNLCPRCDTHPESILYLLRDCECVLELWEQLVEPDVWHLFASLSLDRWLEFNIQRSSMGAIPWNWAFLFACMIHMIWIDRNHYVFSGKSTFPDLFLPKVLGQVAAMEAHLLRPAPSFIEASIEVPVRWNPPSSGTYKLNTDGSHHKGMAACGGLIRNEQGRFIKGFYSNLGTASSVHAELWGITLGLCLAKDLGISSLIVELDSKVVVNMIGQRQTHCSHLRPLLSEVLALLDAEDWSYLINHVFHEANFCADTLAAMGHQGTFQWTILDNPPARLSLVLDADVRGFTSLK